MWQTLFQGSIGCDGGWLAFPIVHHLVSLVAAVLERYLLFCKDHAPIEQKNCRMPLRICFDGLVALWRRHPPGPTSCDSATFVGSTEGEQCRVCGDRGRSAQAS